MTITPEIRKILRNQFLDREQNFLLSHIGHFYMWFGIAEAHLTLTLAFLTQADNIETFSLLVKGMDARAKCDRIRKVCAKFHPMGPEFKQRLNYFEKTIIPIRNKLSHSWPSLDKGVLYFNTVGSMTFEGKILDKNSKPPSIKIDDLFDMGMWLNSWSSDLAKVAGYPVKGKEFELVEPKSDLL